MNHNNFRLSQNFGNLSGSVIKVDTDGWQVPPICKKHKFGVGILKNWFESKDWKNGDHCPRCTLIEGQGDIKDGYTEIGSGVYFPNVMIETRLADYNIRTMHVIGQGADGSVYFLQKISNPSERYAMKMCKIGELQSYTEDQFIREREITQEMGNAKVGPIIYQTWIQRNVKFSKGDGGFEIMNCGFILMELLEETLHAYFRSGRNTLLIQTIKARYMNRLIQRMIEHDIENIDIHFSNMMFGKRDDISTLKIIDWSRARKKVVKEGEVSREIEKYDAMFERHLLREKIEKKYNIKDDFMDVGFGVYLPRGVVQNDLFDFDIESLRVLSHNKMTSVYVINRISIPRKCVIKMCRFTKEYQYKDFINEGRVSEEMGDILIAPFVEEYWITKNVKINDGQIPEMFTCGFIIMEFLEESVDDYLLSKRNTMDLDDIRRMFLTLIRKMSEHNVFHPIDNLKNVMFGKKDDVSTMKLIDWRPSKIENALNKNDIWFEGPYIGV